MLQDIKELCVEFGLQELPRILIHTYKLGRNKSPKPKRRGDVTDDEDWASSEKSDMSDINNSDSSSAKMFESEDDFYVTGDSNNNLF